MLLRILLTLSGASAKSMRLATWRRPIDGEADVCDVGSREMDGDVCSINHGGFNRLLNFRPRFETATFERERAQRLPPRLDQAETCGIVRLADSHCRPSGFGYAAARSLEVSILLDGFQADSALSPAASHGVRSMREDGAWFGKTKRRTRSLTI
jgi:hypothetical protein